MTSPDRSAGQAGTPDSGFGFHGLHHVQLATPPGGEGLAREFYGDILGMTELGKPPALAARGGCWFRLGGLEIHLGLEEDFRPAAKAHPGILVRGLDRLALGLAERGRYVEWTAISLTTAVSIPATCTATDLSCSSQ